MLFFCILKEIFVWIFKKYRKKKNIQKNAKYGLKHEKEIVKILDETELPHKIINNLILEDKGKYTQIDHILINQNGIYVIEDKTYEGFIVGKKKDRMWYNILEDEKNYFFNPIFQNLIHCDILKDKLSFKDLQLIHNVVVFTPYARIVNDNCNCFTTENLYQAFNKRSSMLTPKDVEKIYNQLISLNVKSHKIKKKHFKTIYEMRHDKKNKDTTYNLYDFDNYMFINNWKSKKDRAKRLWINKSLSDFELVKFKTFNHIPDTIDKKETRFHIKH